MHLPPWRAARHPLVRAVAVLVVVIGLAGGAGACSDDDAAAPTTIELPGVPRADNAVPAMEQTPFCAAMLELAASEDATLVDVIDTYESIVDDVPRSIAPEFRVVLERLRLLADGSDVLDVEQAEEATLDLAAFVDLTCRATTMSPLPAPTQPPLLPDPPD